MANICGVVPGTLVLIVIFTLLFVAPSSGDSCQSCDNLTNISVSGINLQNIDPGNLTAFRSIDSREIGRAMDISGYPDSDLEQIGTIITTNQNNENPDSSAAVMSLQTDVVLAMQEANRNLPRFTVPENVTSLPRGSFSHLDTFSYIPSEWDQTGGMDEHCGNCWVWADTGALQLDLAYQKNFTDRLSVQYFTSSYHNGTGIWACCGGSPVWFADFYNTTKKAVPWSNTNASFVDSRSMCEKGESTAMNASNIEIIPYYPLDQVSALMISTNAQYEERPITNETAINAIKSALQSGKAVIFVYTPDNWTPMMNFWNDQTEEDIFTPHLTQGTLYNDGGHVMLILGYNDSDQENQYWIILNSWGSSENRPHAIFRMNMDIDYSLQNPDGVNSYEFYVLNVTYPENSSLISQ
jgi:C1A family cysteine protease